MDRRHIEISDAWTSLQCKLAFIAAASEMEAHALKLGHTDNAMNRRAAWGRTYFLEQIIEELDEVIDGPETPAELKEVGNG